GGGLDGPRDPQGVGDRAEVSLDREEAGAGRLGRPPARRVQAPGDEPAEGAVLEREPVVLATTARVAAVAARAVPVAVLALAPLVDGALLEEQEVVLALRDVHARGV